MINSVFWSKCQNKRKVCLPVSCDEEDPTTPHTTTLNVEENIFPSVSENDQLIAGEMCRSGKFKYLEHKTNCSLFYHCDNGRPVVKFCDSPLLYNKITSVCDWSQNVYQIRPMCQTGLAPPPSTVLPEELPSLEAEREDEGLSDIVIVDSSQTAPGHCDTNE